MNPEYPIYIVSKGRWDSRLTSKALERMGVPYFIIVEEQEWRNYAEVIDSQKILILPQAYLDNYDTFDGVQINKGSGSARNFAWDHSMLKIGAKRHWVLDDNIPHFGRINKNLLIRVTSGTIFMCAEDFVDRYENVALAGFNYDFFAQTRTKLKPFVLNTRIYSVLLIDNLIPYRWRGRFNEDTDLSLRVLKDGLCTVQFNAFIQEKATTQTVKGGNTEVYKEEGTDVKSKMLENMHPDVALVVWRYGRWHHHVNYLPFKKNKLIKKKGLVIPKGINNYGMVLREVKNEKKNC